MVWTAWTMDVPAFVSERQGWPRSGVDCWPLRLDGPGIELQDGGRTPGSIHVRRATVPRIPGASADGPRSGRHPRSVAHPVLPPLVHIRWGLSVAPPRWHARL